MKRIAIDREKCEGCLSCFLACMNSHRTDREDGTLYNLDTTDIKNESRNFIYNAERGYTPVFCRHCDEPECSIACMSGAITKDKDTGHVRYDHNACGACFMCVMNCPFGLPKPDDATRQHVVKCDFCVNKNEEPSCVAACPKEAITVVEVSAE